MQKILIIGNGFDINLGLKTSYKNFLESVEFDEISANNLSQHIKEVQNIQNWVDIEHELKTYANNVRGEPYAQLPYHFQRLKNSLIGYLSRVVEEFIPSQRFYENQAVVLLNHKYLIGFDVNNIDKNVPIFNDLYTFNYTPSPSIAGFEGFETTQIHHVHGSVKDMDIVFGVEDNAVAEDVSFLNKSDHHAFGRAPNVSRAIIAADEVHFFGCSLGDTDNAHFSSAFLEMVKSSIDPKKIVFYVYGKNGYRDLYNRIMILTGFKMSEFKLNHDVIFYDLEKCQVVEQSWINSAFSFIPPRPSLPKIRSGSLKRNSFPTSW